MDPVRYVEASGVAGGPWRESPDWDALAPHWEHFEDGGLNRRVLATVVSVLRPPLLHVGCGRGSLTAVLATRFGPAAVHAVDRSVAMCRRADRDHGIRCVAADGARLPFPDASFATVLCSTGVLEYLDGAMVTEVLTEMGRVCERAGQVLAFAACADGDVHWEVDQHRFVEAWYAGRGDAPSSARALEAVAVALGSREAARDLLLRSMPPTGRAVTAATVVVAASRAGLTVVGDWVDTDGIGLWRLAPGAPLSGEAGRD